MYTIKLNIKNSALEKVIKYLESFSDKIEIIDITESEKKNIYNDGLSEEQEKVLKEREEEYLSGNVKIYSWEEVKSDLFKK